MTVRCNDSCCRGRRSGRDVEDQVSDANRAERDEAARAEWSDPKSDAYVRVRGRYIHEADVPTPDEYADLEED